MLTRAGFELPPSGLDSSKGRAGDRCPEDVSSNPARVNIFQFISAASDYHEKYLLMCISEDDSEIKTNLPCLAAFNPSPSFKISYERENIPSFYCQPKTLKQAIDSY